MTLNHRRNYKIGDIVRVLPKELIEEAWESIISEGRMTEIPELSENYEPYFGKRCRIVDDDGDNSFQYQLEIIGETSSHIMHYIPWDYEEFRCENSLEIE